MNQRNVEALRLELSKAGLSTPMLDIIATNLAEQGVLVPSAMTPDDVFGMCHDSEECVCTQTSVARYLEAVAKGEP
jgi:hypothetical protein